MSRPMSEDATSQLIAELMRLLADRERHYADVCDEGSKIMNADEYNEYTSKLVMKYRGANPRDNDEEICRVLRALEAMLGKRRT